MHANQYETKNQAVRALRLHPRPELHTIAKTLAWRMNWVTAEAKTIPVYTIVVRQSNRLF